MFSGVKYKNVLFKSEALCGWGLFMLSDQLKDFMLLYRLSEFSKTHSIMSESSSEFGVL